MVIRSLELSSFRNVDVDTIRTNSRIKTESFNPISYLPEGKYKVTLHSNTNDTDYDLTEIDYKEDMRNRKTPLESSWTIITEDMSNVRLDIYYVPTEEQFETGDRIRLVNSTTDWIVDLLVDDVNNYEYIVDNNPPPSSETPTPSPPPTPSPTDTPEPPSFDNTPSPTVTPEPSFNNTSEPPSSNFNTPEPSSNNTSEPPSSNFNTPEPPSNFNTPTQGSPVIVNPIPSTSGTSGRPGNNPSSGNNNRPHRIRNTSLNTILILAAVVIAILLFFGRGRQ